MAKKTTTVTEFDENGQVTKITEMVEDYFDSSSSVWLDPRWYRDFPSYYGNITYTSNLRS